MELNEFIKARRKALGLSLQEVGDAINYTPQAIRKFETGDVKIDIRLVGDLIKILNVSLDCFLNADENHIEEYKELPPFDDEKFIARLRYLREKAQITQADFANKLEINKTRVSKLENGESFPNVKEFIKIAKFHNVSYEELYTGIEEKKEEIVEPNIVPTSPKKNKSTVFLILLLVFSNILLLTTSLVFGLTSFNDSSINDNDDGDDGALIDNYHEVTYYFDLSGEEIKENVYHGKKAENLVYKHEGYILEGYYLNDEPFDFSTPITSDIKITGKLKKKSFEVEFYNHKGEVVSKQTAYYLDKVTPPVLPQIPNKRFMKWNSEDYLNVKKDLTIYPIYNSYETTAFLNLNGGEFSESHTTVIENFTYDKLYTLPSLIKKGYKFIEFRYKDQPINENTIFDEAVTLDAIYEANTYTITFYDCYLPELIVKYDEEIHLPRVSSDGSREIERYYMADSEVLDFDFKYNFDHNIGITPVFVGSDFSYTYNLKDNIAEITKINNDAPTLFIPATIDGFQIKKIKKDALKDDEVIKYIVLESKNMQIEEGAFINLPNLISVDFGSLDGTSRLAENTFVNCPNIQYVKLGNPINNKTKMTMRLKEYGFTQNGNLTVELSEHVTVLPIELNRNFGKIKKFIAGDGLKEIKKKHFDFNTLDLEEFVPGKNCMNIDLYLDENFKNEELVIPSLGTWKIYSDVPIKINILTVQTRSYFYPFCDFITDEFTVEGNDCSGKDQDLWITLSTNNKVFADKITLGSKLNIIRPDSIEEKPIFFPKENNLDAYLYGTNVIPDYLNDKYRLGKPEQTKIYFANIEIKNL